MMEVFSYLEKTFGNEYQPQNDRERYARTGALGICTGLAYTATMVSTAAFPPLGLAMSGLLISGGAASLTSATSDQPFDRDAADKSISIGMVKGATAGIVPSSSSIVNAAIQSATSGAAEVILPDLMDGRPLHGEKALERALAQGARSAASAALFQIGNVILSEGHTPDLTAKTLSGAYAAFVREVSYGKSPSLLGRAVVLGGLSGHLCGRIEKALAPEIEANLEEIANCRRALSAIEQRSQEIKRSLPELAQQISDNCGANVTDLRGRPLTTLWETLAFAARTKCYTVHCDGSDFDPGLFAGRTTLTFKTIDQVRAYVLGSNGYGGSIQLIDHTPLRQYMPSKMPHKILIQAPEIDRAFKELDHLSKQLSKKIAEFPTTLQSKIYSATLLTAEKLEHA